METRATAQPGAGFAGGPRRIRGRARRTTEGKVGGVDFTGQRSVGASEEAGGGRFARAEQENERGRDSSHHAGSAGFAQRAGGRGRGAVTETSVRAKFASCTAYRVPDIDRAVETVFGCVRLRSRDRVCNPVGQLSAAMRILNSVGTFENSAEEISMRVKQPSLRSTAWLAVLTMIAGVFFGSQTVLSAGARRQDAPEQEKDKKEQKKNEKKTDKKDEKKGLPLKSDRKIEFTTDEGTWLSLDVSPDAKTIVFELLGDLYTLPIEGGQAKLISGGMAFDSQPKFSPDGKWIAFLSDREGSENIWIIHPDGSGVKQISKNTADDFTSPAWTPDGKYIVASKMPFGVGANELWMFHVDGGTGVQITKSKPTPTTPRKERHNAMGVAASPDGKYLYYAVRQGPSSYNAQLPLWKIVRRDRKTGDEDEIISQPESAFRPTLSPDGKQLAYVTRYETESGLRLRNLETGEDHWVKYPVTRDDQESRFTRDVFPGFAFLPGGKEIVYNQDGKIRRLD